MCCPGQNCTVTKQEYFTKNLEVPNHTVPLPKGFGGRAWCKTEFPSEDITFEAGETVQFCYLRCRNGYFNADFGAAAEFSCIANDDRQQKNGNSLDLGICSGITPHNRHRHLGYV